MSPSSAPENFVHEPIAEADPRVTFEELGVMPDIVEALAEIGITHPFPIQVLSIPIAIQGTDMIGQARTGTGKTLAFGISLLQALLLDSNRSEALRLLVDIYRQIDKEGCSVVMNQGQSRLNSDCAIVHNHICSAYYGLIQVFLETKQYGLAQQTRQNAVQTYHCPPETFRQLFPDQPTTVSSNP